MSKGAPRIYWDANAWIAYIRKEMPTPDNGMKHPRYEMCRGVLQRAEDEQIEIVTSSFTLAEVCKPRKEKPDPSINIAAFFDHSYIFLVDVTKPVGLRAQNLQLSGVGNIRPQDATHVATAQIANVPIFHTFDGDLLALDRTFYCDNGQQLRIVMPGKEVPIPELLRQMEEHDDDRP